MALLLRTDVGGSHAIAERVPTAIESLGISPLDQQRFLHIPAGLSMAAASNGHTDPLIAEADAALSVAERQRKNRTVQAQTQSANVFSAE